MWCGEVCIVSSLSKHVGLLCFGSTANSDVCVDVGFMVQMVFLGMADIITFGKTQTVSENVLTADFTHSIIEIADGPDKCIFP